ncbi:hypothetical protein [Marininema halotolerans]|uniref:Uncharacterized protein n=1 Tax=Marininema halotolerans TaxID=1155944 RepID=A0A1I6R7I7_9BACL|nr:hypothetical protein [Marininema halotolerans]SFS60654.1 hypothetical protein SAMN05444972_104219 [Marininema halotolerans]
MRVKIQREAFEGANDRDLVCSCIEPVVQQVLQQDQKERLQTYHKLNVAQKGLFSFQFLYDHAQSVEEFYYYTMYGLTHPELWEELKGGASMAEDDAMLYVYLSIEKILTPKLQEIAGEWKCVSKQDIWGDHQLRITIEGLHYMYHDIATETLGRYGSRIRKNPKEFVEVM